MERRRSTPHLHRQNSTSQSGGVGVAQQDRTAGQAPEGDSLTTLIASLTGIPVTRTGEDARLAEDLHLDSLGRVQLQSAVEARFGTSIDDAIFLNIETLRAAADRTRRPGFRDLYPIHDAATPHPAAWLPLPTLAVVAPRADSPRRLRGVYRPAAGSGFSPSPAWNCPAAPLPSQPMLLIANHVTWFDVGLVLYALPPHLRPAPRRGYRRGDARRLAARSQPGQLVGKRVRTRSSIGL